jgi:type IV pilus assembly protein PilM
VVRGPAAQATVVLVDIGATTTNIVVTSAGVPQFVRMIPFGGQSITDALRARLEVTEEQAEALKIARGLGNEPATSELDFASIEIIRASALELLNSIRNTLNFYSSTRPIESLEALILSGGGARLSGLARAFGEMFRLPVVASSPFETVDTAKSLKKDERDSDRMTVALGLALGSAA